MLFEAQKLAVVFFSWHFFSLYTSTLLLVFFLLARLSERKWDSKITEFMNHFKQEFYFICHSFIRFTFGLRSWFDIAHEHTKNKWEQWLSWTVYHGRYYVNPWYTTPHRWRAAVKNGLRWQIIQHISHIIHQESHCLHEFKGDSISIICWNAKNKRNMNRLCYQLEISSRMKFNVMLRILIGMRHVDFYDHWEVWDGKRNGLILGYMVYLFVIFLCCFLLVNRLSLASSIFFAACLAWLRTYQASDTSMSSRISCKIHAR